MQCDQCGADVAIGDERCPECGNPLNQTEALAVSDASARETAGATYVEAETFEHKPRQRPVRSLSPKAIAGIVLAVVVIAAFAALGLKSHFDATGTYPVDIAIEAPADGVSATPLPLHVTGTTSKGATVDSIAYVAEDGTGLTLAHGSYEVSVAGLPIREDGTLLLAPDTAWAIEVGDNVRGNQHVTLEEGPIVLSVADPVDIGRSDAEAALELARASAAKGFDFDALETALLTGALQSDNGCFKGMQRYRTTLYTGFCQIAGGIQRMPDIAGAVTVPVECSQFFIYRERLYYTDLVRDGGAASVTLRSCALDGSDEKALAYTVDSGQPVRFHDGWAYFRSSSGEWQRVQLETGEIDDVSTTVPSSQIVILGFVGDSLVYLDYSAGILASAGLMVADADGANPQFVRAIEWNSTSAQETVAVGGGAIVVSRQGNPATLAGYDASGAQIWSTEVDRGYTAFGAYVDGGNLYLRNTLQSGALQVDALTGQARAFGSSASLSAFSAIVGVDGHTAYVTAGAQRRISDTAPAEVHLYAAPISNDEPQRLD